MADSQTHTRFLNPWVLHFQKLGLELKCPFCLNLFDKPMLLPCNHIFCSSCVPKSNLLGSECLLCKMPYLEQELRHAPFVENVVNIYRCLDASFSTQVLNSEIGRVSEQCSAKVPDNSSPVGKASNISRPVPVTNNSSAKAKMEKGSGFASSELRNGTLQLQQHEAVDVDMNQVDLSPDSPPSSGASKGNEEDGHGSRSNITKKFPLKSCKRTVDDLEAKGMNECRDLYLKKQKQSSHGPPELLEGRSTPSTSMNMQTSPSAGSDVNAKSGGDQQAVESDSTSLINFICAFCHTWKETEGSGPMLHFANGKQVVGSEAGHSNVMHVHKSCIEWAPQIFYESDTIIKNLDKELARSAKLKCTSCGLKGAALGCYAKSCRRSYHVPCAFNVPECRWDADEFLMLCPSHSSHKFPSEKSRKAVPKKCTTPAQIYEEQRLNETGFWATSSTEAKKWVFCGSALSADEKLMLVKFAKLCGATVTRTWQPNVTHVIASTDAIGACSRTLKVLMAILKGRWVLKTDWIKACMKLKSPVDEEPFEISLDNHGFFDGPRAGRLRVLANEPELFSGLKFFFTGDFVPTYKRDLQDLIIAAGGTVIDSKEHLQHSFLTESNPLTTLVIYNGDALTGTDDASDVLQRRMEAEAVAAESGSQVKAHTWILNSIASGLKPFVQR